MSSSALPREPVRLPFHVSFAPVWAVDSVSLGFGTRKGRGHLVRSAAVDCVPRHITSVWASDLSCRTNLSARADRACRVRGHRGHPLGIAPRHSSCSWRRKMSPATAGLMNQFNSIPAGLLSFESLRFTTVMFAPAACSFSMLSPECVMMSCKRLGAAFM